MRILSLKTWQFRRSQVPAGSVLYTLTFVSKMCSDLRCVQSVCHVQSNMVCNLRKSYAVSTFPSLPPFLPPPLSLPLTYMKHSKNIYLPNIHSYTHCKCISILCKLLNTKQGKRCRNDELVNNILYVQKNFRN